MRLEFDINFKHQNHEADAAGFARSSDGTTIRKARGSGEILLFYNIIRMTTEYYNSEN